MKRKSMGVHEFSHQFPMEVAIFPCESLATINDISMNFHIFPSISINFPFSPWDFIGYIAQPRKYSSLQRHGYLFSSSRHRRRGKDLDHITARIGLGTGSVVGISGEDCYSCIYIYRERERDCCIYIL